MSHDEMRRLFDAVLTEARPDTTDLDAAVREGRRRRQRRTGAVLLSAAAVIVAGGLVLSGALIPSGPASSDLGGSAPSVPIQSVPIPTSGWAPGDDAMAALLEGTLVRDADDCLVVDGMLIVWPAGYTAREGASGAIEVLDPAQRVVARTGEQLSAGGGSSPVGVTGPCLDGRDASALYQVNQELPVLVEDGDAGLLHERPSDGAPADGVPSVAYLASFVGMSGTAAADRATQDGWEPRVIDPGEAMDFAYGYGRLTLMTDDAGTVTQAFRG